MDFEFISLGIEGCFKVRGARRADSRGWFRKTFHQEAFAKQGIEFECRETYFSMSAPGVLRGMHFQVPPKAHAKLVSCLEGEVLDVIVDLRVKSLTYGKFASLKLTDNADESVYLPPGIAHGFCTLDRAALMSYQTSTTYDPACDSGIRWDSFGFEWPCQNEFVISERDLALPAFHQFFSPF